MTDIDPAAIMAAHSEHRDWASGGLPPQCLRWSSANTDGTVPCEPYLLAEALAFARAQWKLWQYEDEISREALAASEAKVARAQALIDSGECGEEDRWREAISDQTGQAS